MLSFRSSFTKRFRFCTSSAFVSICILPFIKISIKKSNFATYIIEICPRLNAQKCFVFQLKYCDILRLCFAVFREGKRNPGAMRATIERGSCKRKFYMKSLSKCLEKKFCRVLKIVLKRSFVRKFRKSFAEVLQRSLLVSSDFVTHR